MSICKHGTSTQFWLIRLKLDAFPSHLPHKTCFVVYHCFLGAPSCTLRCILCPGVSCFHITKRLNVCQTTSLRKFLLIRLNRLERMLWFFAEIANSSSRLNCLPSQSPSPSFRSGEILFGSNPDSQNAVDQLVRGRPAIFFYFFLFMR